MKPLINKEMKAKLFSQFFQRIARIYPSLKIRLKQARIQDKPEDFVKKTIMSSLYMTLGVALFLFFIFAKFGGVGIKFFLFMPVMFVIMFFYLFKLPEMKTSKKAKEINREIVFAARFLIIELESGVPLYNAMANISKNFETVGRYFKEITDKIDLGTSMEDALNEAVEIVPSDDMRKILWQIINSMRTGSNIATSLYSIVAQISEEQITEVNRYGKKLNPLAMFYMMIAVIMPSLGIAMLVIFSSFINFTLDLSILLILAGLLTFVQFMFISMVKFSRPAIDF